MVFMVLDHTRSFYFGFRPNPLNLEQTTPVLFFTRWITHFCAPGFVLLAGVAAYLYGRKYSKDKLIRFLWTRGFWLILLEWVVIRLIWVPKLSYQFTVLQVIWALGCSMVILSILCRLPTWFLGGFGSLMIIGHNLLDGHTKVDFGQWGWLWSILHQPSVLTLAPGYRAYVGYPLIPWIGVICLGYALGYWFTVEPTKRKKFFLWLGGGMVVAFVLLRWSNVYGNPKLWSDQGTWLWTFISFLNCKKYPPSLLFLLMTLGPMFMVLPFLEKERYHAIEEKLILFGRVPLFFYIAHLYLLRFSGRLLSYLRFGDEAFKRYPGPGGTPQVPLFMVYVVSFVALLILYQMCKWFAEVKARRDDWWLKYL